MHRRLVTIVPVLSMALGLALATTAVAAPGTFVAPLSGGEEVLPDGTVGSGSQGTGVAVFQLSADGTSLSYRLNAANIENVTQAHIHLAPPGTNGGVVVWLYPSAPPAQLIPGRTDGNLSTGTITAANLVGALAGQPLDALLTHIADGNAYVNIHTLQFPGGEIRGQIDVPTGHQN
jgi:hypothetical protein